jgi:hypothetical protein
MGRIRQAILDDTFAAFKDDFLQRYQPTDAGIRAEQKQKWLESRPDRQPLD